MHHHSLRLALVFLVEAIILRHRPVAPVNFYQVRTNQGLYFPPVPM